MSIALWSTNYSEVTGQAIVTCRVAEHVMPELGASREFVFPPSANPRAVARWLWVIFRMWRDIALGRIGTLYLVCSRSNGGFVRDAPALLAAKTGVRVIVHSHGSDIIDLLKVRKLSPLARWFYRSCHMIVPSEHLREPLIPYVRSVHVCEGFYAGPDDVLEVRRTVGTESLTVLWNSNVMASKGFFDLFAAIKALHADGCPITLICLGGLVADAELGCEALQKRFSALGKPNWFDYRGRQPHERAVKMLGQADLICLPSRYSSESQGIVIIEAMCAGKAIVASDIPALRATLGDYPASFVPVNSVTALSRALRSLAHEKTCDPVRFHQLRSQFAAKARERFSTARFDLEMKNILTQLQTK
ncbi:glycosyltransferase [Amylibacter sp.]|nr:glycosyltransferase [Amylibacter sp.]